jgi:hypothetical protein
MIFFGTYNTHRKPQVRLLAGFHLKFICAAPVDRTRGSAYKSVGMLTKLWADQVQCLADFGSPLQYILSSIQGTDWKNF